MSECLLKLNLKHLKHSAKYERNESEMEKWGFHIDTGAQFAVTVDSVRVRSVWFECSSRYWKERHAQLNSAGQLFCVFSPTLDITDKNGTSDLWRS